MKIDILTLFPGMFENVLGESMMKIARQKGLAQIEVHDLRDWTEDNHRTADDKPYGGGPGMVMKVEPVDKALSDLRKDIEEESVMTILLTPQGQRFNQDAAKALAPCGHMILVCGHYEGVDERIRELVDMELSIGDYVLTCGEVPAMVVCDAVVRLIPGVLGDAECLLEESFEDGYLEYPQYTRPSDYKNMTVPEVLLCGDPKKIDQWRREQVLARTRARRPDLLD
ncbi:MAG: tRNA (guanosine(37)-N1)-methyltransferase TrmD [Candidatus Tantalella remota]|nr:tRNA (guanosine(37)-N1)-methyltransferase TrmD [Candidatus Tantalella remota]